MGYIQIYWDGPCLLLDDINYRLYVRGISSNSTPDIFSTGLLSDTITPSFFWTANTANATPVEALGSGYVRVELTNETVDNRKRFAFLKETPPSFVIDAHTIAKSASDLKAWSSKLVVGYVAGVCTLLLETNTVLYESTGATSWTIDFTAAQLSEYMDHVKLDVTGAVDTNISWRTNALYTMV